MLLRELQKAGVVNCVAAAVLIAASLALPMLSRNQVAARKIGCAANLATAGQALTQYADDFNQSLPRGPMKRNGNQNFWFYVGPDAVDADGNYRSNSAHLRLIIRKRYLHPDVLDCPDDTHRRSDPGLDGRDWASHRDVPYSYQNQFTAKVIRLNHAPHLAILADKNPHIRIMGRKFVWQRRGAADAPSDQHGQQGQNVLVSSGAVYWSRHPVVPNAGHGDPDNIFTLKGVNHYYGHEAPLDPLFDAFLVP